MTDPNVIESASSSSSVVGIEQKNKKNKKPQKKIQTSLLEEISNQNRHRGPKPSIELREQVRS